MGPRIFAGESFGFASLAGVTLAPIGVMLRWLRARWRPLLATVVAAAAFRVVSVCREGLRTSLVVAYRDVMSALSQDGCALEDELKHRISGQTLLVCNGHYVATVNVANGELTQVCSRDGNWRCAHAALTKDRLEIRTTRANGGFQTVETTQLPPVEGPTIVEAHDFYLKLSTRLKIESWPVPLYVLRTYEFTRSPHIYEQVQFTSALDVGYPAQAGVTVERLAWTITPTQLDPLQAVTTASDLLASYPPSHITGSRMTTIDSLRSAFASTAQSLLRIVVWESEGCQECRESMQIDGGEVLLLNAVISIAPTLIDPNTFTARWAQFYPGFGIIKEGELQVMELGERARDLIPVQRDPLELEDLRRDYLIRLSMHLRWVMQTDRWWPKGNFDGYPDGDIFTPYARSFPFMAYTWVLLTVRRSCGEWRHYAGDADILYRELRNLVAHYVPGDRPHFEDVLLGMSSPFDIDNPMLLERALRGEGIKYLSFSAARKERDFHCFAPKCRGVLNAHAEALHVAWLMREASELYGDEGAENKWRAIVEKYHPGSLALLDMLYPYKDDGQPKWGVVRYRLGYPSDVNSGYNALSFGGIAAGYLHRGRYELEFVDAVDRAYDRNYYADQHDPTIPWFTAGGQPFVARLCRVLPVALSLTADGSTWWEEETWFSPIVSMSGAVREAASLREVLTYGELLGAGASGRYHDSSKVIVEGARNQWIVTNSRFFSWWVPGFWEEVGASEVPEHMRFSAQVDLGPGPAGTRLFVRPPRWTVARHGDTLLVLSNFGLISGDKFVISFPVRHLKFAVRYKDYNAGVWGPNRLVGEGETRSAQSNTEIQLPPGLGRKSLAIVIVGSDDYRLSVLDRIRVSEDLMGGLLPLHLHPSWWPS